MISFQLITCTRVQKKEEVHENDMHEKIMNNKKKIKRGIKKLLKGIGTIAVSITIAIVAITILAKVQINVWDTVIAPKALNNSEMQAAGFEDPTGFCYVLLCAVPHILVLWSVHFLLIREECIYVYKCIHYIATKQ